MTRVALDAMGGEGAPAVPVRAARDALAESDEALEVVLVGDAGPVGDALDAAGSRPAGLAIAAAGQQIGDEEPPARAVRRKPDSSISVGLRLVRDGDADAFVSAGSTGAIVAGSMLVLGGLPAVERPALGAVVPTADAPTLLLDVGANVASRPGHLRQFARMGTVYARELLGRREPRVGLLNVGEEAGKGDEVVAAAHELLRSDPDLDFVGNVEGHGLVQGRCDVLVCDGFVGNVLLKFYEAIAERVVGLLEDASSGPVPAEHRRIRRTLDYAEYGGAPLLGVDGVAVVCHGASSARAVRNAVLMADRAARSGVLDALAEGP